MLVSCARIAWSPSRSSRKPASSRNDPEGVGMRCLMSGVVAIVACAAPAAAQDYPTRPVRAIVAVGPGGTADIFTRVLGEELHKRWGQPLIVENRAGGASNI